MSKTVTPGHLITISSCKIICCVLLNKVVSICPLIVFRSINILGNLRTGLIIN